MRYKTMVLLLVILFMTLLPTTSSADDPPCELLRLDADTYMHLEGSFGGPVAMSADGEYVGW